MGLLFEAPIIEWGLFGVRSFMETTPSRLWFASGCRPRYLSSVQNLSVVLGVGFGRCSLRRFREEKGEKGKGCRAWGLGALNPQPKP